MVLNFNENRFLVDENGNKREVEVPFDLMLGEKRYENSPNSSEGSYFKGGIYHYQKFFDVNVSACNDYFALHFWGAYRKATVLINDDKLKINKNGFNDFYVEFKAKEHNKIDVIVDNSLIPNCRWYTGSGIYRDVELIHKKKNEIKRVFVKTLDYKTRKLAINVDSNAPYVYEIYDETNLIYKGSEKIISLDNLKLWDLNSPKLYSLIVKSENDEERVKFGVRKVELIPSKGLFLNGERVILKGACIHSDNGFLGAASFKDIERKKVEMLKENGFNAIRCSHNPCSHLFLDISDELGMLVIDEAFDGWFIPKNYHDNARIFDEVYEDTIKNMVYKDLNHPSVIMYSFGNELTEVATKKGLKTLKTMQNLVKNLDDTRFTTCGVNLLIAVYYKLGIGVYKDTKTYEEKPLPDRKKGYKEKKNGSSFFNAMMQKLGGLMFFMAKSKMAGKVANDVSKIIDVVGLNYGTPRYKIDSKKHPERFMIGSETMVKHIKVNYLSSFKYPNVLGDFIWSGIDYLGEAGSNDYRYYSYKGLPLLAGAGVIDFSFKKNAEMDYVSTIWNEEITPKIFVSPLNHYNETPFKSAWRFTDKISSYNFKGYENKKCEIDVFSSAYKVKLLINDKVIGIKKLKDSKATFKTKYKEGEVKAIAIDKNNKVLSTSKLITGQKLYLNVRTSKDKLSVKNKDIAILEIEFVDENCVIYPNIETDIQISTSNNLKLMALGSAITVTDESYLNDHFKTYRGRVVAYVKAINDKENVGTIRIHNDLVEDKEIKVEVLR